MNTISLVETVGLATAAGSYLIASLTYKGTWERIKETFFLTAMSIFTVALTWGIVSILCVVGLK